MELPKWVWDLVIAIDKYESEHDYIPDRSNCLMSLSNIIPRDVHNTAESIRKYLLGE